MPTVPAPFTDMLVPLDFSHDAARACRPRSSWLAALVCRCA